MPPDESYPIITGMDVPKPNVGKPPDPRLAAVIAKAKRHLEEAKAAGVTHARLQTILKFIDEYYGFDVKERFPDKDVYEDKIAYFGWLLGN